MKGKIVFLVLNCLMVLSLLLASCAPKAPEVTPPKEGAPAAPTAPKEVAPTAAKEVAKKEYRGLLTKQDLMAEAAEAEAPRYGGSLTLSRYSAQEMYGLDQVYLAVGSYNVPITIVYEQLAIGDWAKGLAGTGEVSFSQGGPAPEGVDQYGASLATSWEIPDDNTMIFKIRQGVYWQNKPPVNGREMDANDVAFAINRNYTQTGFKTLGMANFPGGGKVTSVTATDKWTVVVKMSGLAPVAFEDITGRMFIVAPEVIEKYGDVKEWRNMLGTGPWMLSDYVVSSSMTFLKHPKYWRQDPVGPGKGNQLPYLDKLTYLFLGDRATLQAALRTAKIDLLEYDVQLDDVKSLLRQRPALKAVAAGVGEQMTLVTWSQATDPLGKPLLNQRVRQALWMAVDNPSIIKEYYEGLATPYAMLSAPGSPNFTPVAETPKVLQESFGFSAEEAQVLVKMYGYYPEEAKKILAEEGYPNGFKTMVYAENEHVNRLSIVKEYWKKNLNVDLEIALREPAVMRSMRRNRAWVALSATPAPTPYEGERFRYFGPSSMDGPRNDSNSSGVVDPIMNGMMAEVEKVYGDIGARSKILKPLEVYMLQLGWWLAFPAPYDYRMWWPWLKNYHGESSLGNKGNDLWTMYAWLDQDLKKSMGY